MRQVTICLNGVRTPSLEQFCWIWDGPGWVISDWVRHRLGARFGAGVSC